MLLPLLHIAIICTRLTSVVLSLDDRCPEATGSIGYRDGGECTTFARTDFYVDNVRRIYAIIDEFCEDKYKNGYRYGFMWRSQINHNSEWREKINTIECFGNYFFVGSSGYDCWYVWYYFGYHCSGTVYYVIRGNSWQSGTYRHKKNLISSFTPHGSDAPLDSFEYPHYRRMFFDDNSFPLCATYSMSASGYSFHTLVNCAASYSGSLYGKDLYVACRHSPYKNCLWEKETNCHYDEKDGKWYKFVVKVTRYGESPYGAPCPTEEPESHKVPCAAACKGNWGEWSKEPSEAHLRCDQIIVYRYRPADTNYPPCNKTDVTCCPAMKVITYPDKCIDFAFNTTINLKKEGCKNNGTLGTDSHGHYMCVCTDQYIGVQCEIDVCKDHCQNTGTCIAGMGKPHCFCPKGFTGKQCETATKACGELGECINGGKCEQAVVNTVKVSICKCPEEFGGSSCEKAVEKCEPTSCNLNGVCKENEDYGTIQCMCYEGFEGVHCETKDGKSVALSFEPTTTNVMNLALGLLLGFLLLTLFCGGAAVHHHRRRRRRRGHGMSSSSSYSSYLSSHASSFSTAISRTFTRQSKRAKTKNAGTRPQSMVSSKAVGISKRAH
uniref:EGF-like domain-containing protein n=1 Tax=Trichuris muris TaxID=70415 RepID=A0A5S6QXF6_TRIMR